MALTSNDETDLLLPLYRGFDETPRFATFLARLRRRAGTPRAGIVLDGEQTQSILPLDPAMVNAMRPYRAYALVELMDQAADDDARLVMFPLSDGMRGWLYIAGDRPCTAADSALLSSLAPYVQSVVSTWRDRERERAASALTSDGLTRTGAGWILFDADARVLAIEPETCRRLESITLLPLIPGERLRGIAPAAERKLAQIAPRFAEESGFARQHCVLYAQPRVEAVLAPVEPKSGPARQFPAAAMVAWCRFEPPVSKARIDALAALHELPRREAELAVAMADGLSISQAANQMGLTIETARNYTKQLYAKLDISGQAQLVRLVQQSAAMLA